MSPKRSAFSNRTSRCGTVASAIVVAWYESWIPADIAIGALILAGALLVNGIMGKCGLYAMLGFSTCKIRPPKHHKK